MIGVKVSVIVPIYNVEAYLENCIKSILSQTFSDFELILVDDGSPDSCGTICDNYALKDSRVKVLHQENGGLSCARNNAIDIAKGEYITFIDSDDFVFPQYLEKLVSACECYLADMAVCGFVRCSSSEMLCDVTCSCCGSSLEVFESDRMKAFFVTDKISTTAWGKIYKRELFASLKYPVGKYNEDVFTTYITVHLSNKVVVCDYLGYVYRKNDKSIINESFSPKKMDAVEGCVERAKFIEKEYPKLKKYAYRAVVYACNQVLLSMGRAKARDDKILNDLQCLYRMYLLYYVFCKSALLGKFFALISFVNVRWSLLLVNKMGV